MKVLLIHPPTPSSVYGINDEIARPEPLAMEYIGAGLKGHHDVKILDMRLNKGLKEELERFKPHIVGVTGFTPHFNNATRILREIKEFDLSILTVMGGIHVTCATEDFIDSGADILVIGEGVFTFKEIAERFEKGQDLTEIESIAIPKDGKLYRSKPKMHPSLDSLPFPDRQLTAGNRDEYFLRWMKPVALLRTSLGCCDRCNFCLQWKLSGGKYLTRDPEVMIEELASIDAPNISLADDESFLDAKKMMHFAELIIKGGIKKNFRSFARAATIVKHPDLFEKWVEVGLKSVLIGFEAFKDEHMKLLNKHSSVFLNEEAIRILQRLGIEFTADFIVRPDFTKDDFRELRSYVRALKVATPAFPVLTPFPGTALYEATKSEIFIKNYDLYDLGHTVLPTRLPLKEFYEKLAWLKATTIPAWRVYGGLLKKPFREVVPELIRRRKVLASTRNAYMETQERELIKELRRFLP